MSTIIRWWRGDGVPRVLMLAAVGAAGGVALAWVAVLIPYSLLIH
jgi:hypothetical protein